MSLKTQPMFVTKALANDPFWAAFYFANGSSMAISSPPSGRKFLSRFLRPRFAFTISTMHRVMEMTRMHFKVFQAVVRFVSVDVVNMKILRDWTVGFCPHSAVL